MYIYVTVNDIRISKISCINTNITEPIALPARSEHTSFVMISFRITSSTDTALQVNTTKDLQIWQIGFLLHMAAGVSCPSWGYPIVTNFGEEGLFGDLLCLTSDTSL